MTYFYACFIGIDVIIFKECKLLMVNIDNNHSQPAEVLAGVLQGSVFTVNCSRYSFTMEELSEISGKVNDDLSAFDLF